MFCCVVFGGGWIVFVDRVTVTVTETVLFSVSVSVSVSACYQGKEKDNFILLVYKSNTINKNGVIKIYILLFLLHNQNINSYCTTNSPKAA